MVVDLEQKRRDFLDAYSAFVENKDSVKALNEANRELCKQLDEQYELPKGATKAWIQARIKREEGKDMSEEVESIEADLEAAKS